MYQKIIIAGNLGADPDMRYLPNGTAVCTLSVATNRKWKNQDGSAGEETVWFRVTCWRKLAEICSQYLTKGRQVLVEGRLTPDPDTGGPRVWTGNDGVAKASFEMTAFEVKFLGSRGNGGQQRSGPVTSGQDEMDEIPF